VPKNNNGASLGFENDLWRATDALRSNMDAAEYKQRFLQCAILEDQFESLRGAACRQLLSSNLLGHGWK